MSMSAYKSNAQAYSYSAKETMKIALFLSLVASTAAFSQEASRRDALAAVASAGAAFVPVVANAAVGESPRFSVFGVLGDGTSYSEGAAYGSDQATKLYSPYSVYDNAGDNSVYKPDDPSVRAKKVAILKETEKRLAKLDGYIAKKQWFNVEDELARYMYETRGAVRGLATTAEQKAAATAFFKAIEETNINSRLKKQDACQAAASKSQQTFQTFVSMI